MTSVLLIAAAQVAFSIETPKSTYLVGEPVVVTVTQHGRARIYPEGWFEMGPGGHMRVLVDRGHGFERFRRKLVLPPGLSEHGPWETPDGTRQEIVLSYDDAIGDVLFPAAGRVRMALEYEDDAIGRVRSNVVTLRIEAPGRQERRAWDAIRALPGAWVFFFDLTDDGLWPLLNDPAARRVAAAFPKSVYVQGARRSDGALTIAHARALVAELAGGQFEPDALAILARVYESENQDALARRTWQRLVDRFPRRAAADDAREALASDDEADDDGPAPSYATGLTNADLRLVATAPSRILVGDFLTIRTTWTARYRIKEPVEYGWVEIDRGAGFQPHVEGLNGWTCSVSTRQMRPGQSLVTEHVVGLAARDAPVQLSGLDGMHASAAFAFDRPGLYRVKVRHDAAESNVMVVEVAAPQGEDARLLEALRLRPAILSSYGGVDESLRAEGLDLVRTYGRHRLLKPFLDRYEGRGADPVRRVDHTQD